MALDNSSVFLHPMPKWGEAREIRHRPLAIIRRNARSSNRKVSTIFAYFHLTSLPTQVCGFRRFLSDAHQYSYQNVTHHPPLDFNHQKGEEIPTKHKEAIRQLYSFAKLLV
jgi:hypothetical protein